MLKTTQVKLLDESKSDPLFIQFVAWLLNLWYCSLSGQGGQQVVTQIIRGQAVSTAISAASPVATVTGQGVASPNTAGQAAGQTPPGTPRAQGQGQVKLTLAQLTQLTQVCEVLSYTSSISTTGSIKMDFPLLIHIWKVDYFPYALNSCSFFFSYSWLCVVIERGYPQYGRLRHTALAVPPSVKSFCQWRAGCQYRVGTKQRWP